MDAFARLGLAPSLLLSEEEIRTAFRNTASTAHPDKGGDDADFSARQAAQIRLLNPATRLQEWCAFHEIECNSRGQISGSLIDLFQQVSTVGGSAEKTVRDDAQASSALVKAVIEVAKIGERDQISDLLEVLDAEIAQRLELFPLIEKRQQSVESIQRDLSFLLKWKNKLQELYSQLI